MPSRASLALCIVLSIASCRETSDARPSLVLAAQVLALEADPSEAVPGARVSYRVLAVDTNGPLEPEGLQLSYCRTPKTLADNRVASTECAQDVENDSPIERLPSDACARFGPSVPMTARPPDPDATGGYYQPVRVAFDAVRAVGLERLRCPLVNAPIALTREFRERYVSNQNPELSPLSISLAGAPLALEALPPSSELTLSVAWPDSSRERYVMYDAYAVALVERSEGLRVSWYVTAGELAFDHTGRGANDPALTSENRWRTPDTEQSVHLWIVLRDDRGGTTHAAYELSVR